MDLSAKIDDMDESLDEIEVLYENMLEKIGVRKADVMLAQYQEEVEALGRDRLSNEQISYYLVNFGHVTYILRAGMARQGLASDLVTIHKDLVYSKAFTEAQPEGAKKLTREDKQAIAQIEIEAEAIIDSLYTRVTQAMDQRIRSLELITRTLENLAWMNRSEERLGRTQ